MLAYQGVAIALKGFSATRGTRRMYRWLGNWIGQGQRKKQFSPYYVKRGKCLLDRLEEIGLTLTPSSHVLEIGTGWMHFYSLFLRLFLAPQITGFDVTDNRQLSALQGTFRRLSEHLTEYLSLSQAQEDAIRALIREMVAASSFDELYELVGFTYRVDPAGDLSDFEDNCFDLVFGFDVLEHVQRDDLDSSIESYYRILKPGGYSIQQIGLDDHLAHYDGKASRKRFLAYSESEWKLRFENGVQYFNRVPYREFLSLFENCGFARVHASALREPEVIRDLPIARQYQSLSLEDLEATRAFFIHRKPVVDE
jgi:SAM-dependent methyltransferase